MRSYVTGKFAHFFNILLQIQHQRRSKPPTGTLLQQSTVGLPLENSWIRPCKPPPLQNSCVRLCIGAIDNECNLIDDLCRG